MVAVVKVPVNHDASADAGPEREKDARIVIACRPLPMFAKDGEIHVVLDDDRGAERLTKDGRDRNLLPSGKVRRKTDDRTRRRIDGARHAGANGQQTVHRHFGGL